MKKILETSPLFAFARTDFPQIHAEEPWLLHAAYADWTEGHNHVMHRHEDRAEIFILLNGSGTYNIGSQMYQIQAGDVVLCNTHVMHDEFPAKSKLYDTLTLGIANVRMPGLEEGQLIGEGCVPVFRRSEQTEQIRDIAALILRKAAEGDPAGRMLCHYLMLAALELVRLMAGAQEESRLLPDPDRSGPQSLCRKVEEYLNDHYMEEITLEETAKRFYVSPWYLSHVFKEETSYNFKQYLLRLRLGEAQMQLTITGDSIADIALACGFHDPAYFSRLFARHIGVSPLKYRRMRSGTRTDGSGLPCCACGPHN